MAGRVVVKFPSNPSRQDMLRVHEMAFSAF
jgi:hypothetical protein